MGGKEPGLPFCVALLLLFLKVFKIGQSDIKSGGCKEMADSGRQNLEAIMKRIRKRKELENLKCKKLQIE